ncbi:zf-DHHC-domain-containing protein [Ascobolus immersus RN42]|uniref:Palmitoyltransferase n=1 Tax=Ascobolus immersus RN42 TaxID=1160509 RepID=A0A3N4I7Q8_ASCIM|nr:zf-DHHC-domain-containing protein [Ascobolus immersus RN42]
MPTLTAYDLLRAAKDSFSSDTRPSTSDSFSSPASRHQDTMRRGSMDSDGLPALDSPTTGRRRKFFGLRRLDRLCCDLFTYSPIALVYAGTTWAVWTEAWSIAFGEIGGWRGAFLGLLGIFLYIMSLWSYTHAVITSPGTPSSPGTSGYTTLPTHEPSTHPITIKSTGTPRFCKKCQFRKPDRTHHCSSCNTCILKMDHHCPWLATCLGLHNYKSFLLFLTYTSLLCLLAFAVSSAYVYHTIFDTYADETEFDAPINWTLMAVMSGIIGLVLTGFTGWHFILVSRNMTTIESLEKVRYNTPAFSRAPPGAQGLTQEQSQYYNYLSDVTNSKPLPHAFDLGAKRNFAQVFGTREQWVRWFCPLPSTAGDGFTWETSEAWRVAALERQAEQEAITRRAWMGGSGDGGFSNNSVGHFQPHPEFGGNPNGLIHGGGMPPITRHPAVGGGKKVARVESTGIIRTSQMAGGQRDVRVSKAERVLGYTDGPGESVPMVPIRRVRRDPDADLFVDSDEEGTVVEETSVAGSEGRRSPGRVAPVIGDVRRGSAGEEEDWKSNW